MEAGGFVVQKHWRATQERVEKFLSDTYFTDANLRGRYVFFREVLNQLPELIEHVKVLCAYDIKV